MQVRDGGRDRWTDVRERERDRERETRREQGNERPGPRYCRGVESMAGFRPG